MHHQIVKNAPTMTPQTLCSTLVCSLCCKFPLSPFPIPITPVCPFLPLNMHICMRIALVCTCPHVSMRLSLSLSLHQSSWRRFLGRTPSTPKPLPSATAPATRQPSPLCPSQECKASLVQPQPNTRPPKSLPHVLLGLLWPISYLDKRPTQRIDSTANETPPLMQPCCIY
jgi:hypothetical protein